jgi:hypothetical protein
VEYLYESSTGKMEWRIRQRDTRERQSNALRESERMCIGFGMG